MSILDNFHHIKSGIAEAESQSQRPPGSVKLLAVSKGQPVSAIIEAYQGGQTDFGESYLQEARTKIQALAQYPLTWHFIGPMQSNKAKIIAEHFHWVHSLGRERIAELLDRHRPASLPVLQVCIQVNISEEKGKSGIPPEDALPFAEKLLQYPRLQLRGLMLIPPQRKDEEAQYQEFLTLHNLMQNINTSLGINMDTLSMGMTEDFILAIKAGSTIVRLGRSFFG